MKSQTKRTSMLGALMCTLSSCGLLAPTAPAQDATAGQRTGSASGTVVPRLVQFGGAVTDSNGKPAAGRVALTFSLYELQVGGTPLWSETQSVTLDSKGSYTAFLGAASPDGLPLDLFTTGAARWLGVQPQLAGVGELPRVLLVGVPYALKAADADTLGGNPASAFMLAGAQTVSSEAGPSSATNGAATAGVQGVAQSQNADASAITGSGTTNTIPIFTGTTTIGNSLITQSGGAAVVSETLQLPATGTATSSKGFNSQPFDGLASAFNSSTHAAVSQHFRWQAEPVNNNTSSPSGKFNLLFASGTSTPAETGLSIANTGKITFASGQTFPGTGTVTSIGSGAGLTGGPITGSGSLSIANAGVTNAMLQHSSLTVSPGTDLSGGGAISLGSSVTLSLDTNKVPQLIASNTFTGNQTVTGNVTATGSVSAGTLSGNGAAVTGVNASLLNGIPSSSFAFITASNTFPADQYFNGNGRQMIVGDPGCGSGFAAIGFGALSSCNNYSLLGDGTNTYINRPTGGTLYIREGNGNEMTIGPGGGVAIKTSQSTFQPALIATTSFEGVYGMESFGGGGDLEFGFGGSGLFAEGGTETNTGTQGGDGGGIAVFAYGASGNFVGGDGIDAYAGYGPSASGYAGNFIGDVQVSGALFAGTKDFRIDHPLDPGNKYLYHASVESSEMMDIYTGNATLGPGGAATVQLPDWFEAVNTDFRYQLTAIGAAAPNLHVAEEVADHQFSIAGGAPGMKVSWQVSGVRHDAFAQAHPLAVEVDKPANERGYYIHPELYGQPAEKQTEWGRNPAKMRNLKERQAETAKQPRVKK